MRFPHTLGENTAAKFVLEQDTVITDNISGHTWELSQLTEAPFHIVFVGWAASQNGGESLEEKRDITCLREG